MREIKFRAWDRKAKAMFPVHTMNFGKMSNELESLHGVNIHHKDSDHDGDVSYGGHIHKKTGTPLLPKFELMQYTGLKDKNGKEIYEGDIIRSVALSNDHHQRGAIVVSPVEYWTGNACLSITYTPIYPFCIDHEIEVIGNIYEQPNLLEETQNGSRHLKPIPL